MRLRRSCKTFQKSGFWWGVGLKEWKAPCGWAVASVFGWEHWCGFVLQLDWFQSSVWGKINPSSQGLQELSNISPVGLECRRRQDLSFLACPLLQAVFVSNNKNITKWHLFWCVWSSYKAHCIITAERIVHSGVESCALALQWFLEVLILKLPSYDFKACKVLTMLCGSGRLSLWKYHHSSSPVWTVLESENSMLEGLGGTKQFAQKNSQLPVWYRQTRREKPGYKRKGCPIWAQQCMTEQGDPAHLISHLIAVSNCVQGYPKHSGCISNISCISTEAGAIATSELPFWQNSL